MRINPAVRYGFVVLVSVALGLMAIGLFSFRSGHVAKGLAQSECPNDIVNEPSVVRLAVVHTPESSGLLDALLPDFEKQTGYKVQVLALEENNDDVYGLAIKCHADLVISHYGHPDLEGFVTNGTGMWPRTVFANQAALLGPSSDPANIRGLTDAVQAFGKIAASGTSRFELNNSAAEKYLAEMLWEGAGRPDRTESWYIDKGLNGREVVEDAAQQGAYTLWGLVPFLIEFGDRLKCRDFQDRLGGAESGGPGLDKCHFEALILQDAVLQRVMAAVMVNAKKVAWKVNVEGAEALQRFLIAPRTQIRIRDFRYPGLDHQMWWPFGRSNSREWLRIP